MIKILLVDDYALVRIALRRLLKDEPTLDVVGEAQDGEEALTLALQLAVDVVLMEIKMPGIGGIEATRRLLCRHPDLKVLGLSMCQNSFLPLRLLQAGARGYLRKDASAEAVVCAIQAVYAGKLMMADELAMQLALERLSKQPSNPFHVLSDRELPIAMMIASGATPATIAHKLHVHRKTINARRYYIFHKLAVSGDVALTHLALRYGLLKIA